MLSRPVGGWDVTLSVESAAAAVAICQSNVKDTPFDLLIFPFLDSVVPPIVERVEVLTGVAPWFEIWYTYLQYYGVVAIIAALLLLCLSSFCSWFTSLVPHDFWVRCPTPKHA